MTKTNPIKPNTNPIRKRPKINANFCYDKDLQWNNNVTTKKNEPNRTQTEPNTNPKTNPISAITSAGTERPPFPALLFGVTASAGKF